MKYNVEDYIDQCTTCAGSEALLCCLVLCVCGFGCAGSCVVLFSVCGFGWGNMCSLHKGIIQLLYSTGTRCANDFREPNSIPVVYKVTTFTSHGSTVHPHFLQQCTMLSHIANVTHEQWSLHTFLKQLS